MKTAHTSSGDKIRFNMDKSLYTGVILLDLKKDAVDHNIRFKIKSRWGHAIKWFLPISVNAINLLMYMIFFCYERCQM